MKRSLEESILDKRRAGVLLHPSSLPGKQRIGDIGSEARNFLHFMADCGLSVWQMLPLGPTHLDGSPYQCLSSHAGNPELINLQWLQEQDWLEADDVNSAASNSSNHAVLKKAARRFFDQADPAWQKKYAAFVKENSYWLQDYALFMALKHAHDDKPWMQWPVCYRFCDPQSLQDACRQHDDFIHTVNFEQFVFFSQWHELRDYAASLDIQLFGDMPIYISQDSADVWSKKENFLMQPDGRCEFVAGVPPDAFSDEGQRWGNPLYDWDYLQQHKFAWWVERFKTQLELFDLIRIDHFRGLEACWHIADDAETAIDGKWVKTPGNELLTCLHDKLSPLPLVAEDLGYITEEVRDLRDDFNLPGMAVLQFAFDGQNDNHYLPHNHTRNSVVYSGTHDNDTTKGWYETLPEFARRHLHHYLGQSEIDTLNMPWVINRMALSSVARLAVLPMQDLLGLGSEHRMNTPGTLEGNWQWRFDWNQVWPELPGDLQKLITLYDRYPESI